VDSGTTSKIWADDLEMRTIAQPLLPYTYVCHDESSGHYLRKGVRSLDHIAATAETLQRNSRGGCKSSFKSDRIDLCAGRRAVTKDFLIGIRHRNGEVLEAQSHSSRE
jgi:hypothetical protein